MQYAAVIPQRRSTASKGIWLPLHPQLPPTAIKITAQKHRQRSLCCRHVPAFPACILLLLLTLCCLSASCLVPCQVARV